MPRIESWFERTIDGQTRRVLVTEEDGIVQVDGRVFEYLLNDAGFHRLTEKQLSEWRNGK